MDIHIVWITSSYEILVHALQWNFHYFASQCTVHKRALCINMVHMRLAVSQYLVLLSPKLPEQPVDTWQQLYQLFIYDILKIWDCKLHVCVGKGFSMWNFSWVKIFLGWLQYFLWMKNNFQLILGISKIPQKWCQPTS